MLIIIINWNKWEDTIDCLESVLNLSYSNFQVVVLDNHSTNDSFHQIKSWLNNTTSLSRLSHLEISQNQILKTISNVNMPNVLLVHSDCNLGFAGGNNLVLNAIMQRDDIDYVWLLNNDTIVDSDSLFELVRTFETQFNVGIAGSVLLDFNKPERIQMAGGLLYECIGIPKKNYKNKNINQVISSNRDRYLDVDYVSGASLLVPTDVIRLIGFLSEDYFMYWEETDWCKLAKEKFGLRIMCNLDSKVFHKESTSIGFKSTLQQTFDMRNTLIYFSKYGKLYLPSILLIKPTINLISAFKHQKSLLNSIRSDFRGVISFIKFRSKKPQSPVSNINNYN